MYSKNDYRYYLENQLMYSDDFLAHYGVKGMKWKNHKANGDPERVGTNIAIGAYETNIDGRMALLDQTRGRAKTEQYKGKSSEYLREVESNSKKNNFPKSTVSSTKKKKISKIRKKFGLYRTKPKGKKLKGGGNIYVSHS